ncbi:hypothetical protein MW887_009351 [Aspergillus wentii]|nr:hypothetical protein MW887_009351 [Aspergillus wentii]
MIFIGRTARQKQTSEHVLTVHTQDQEIRFAASVALESLALCFGQLVQWIDLQGHDNCKDQEKDQRKQGQAVFNPEATGKSQPKGYLATAK